jgi:serine kinase of HPr protein (carbohydrate metabolism regulator)
MTPPLASVHASAVCVGEQAILIRGTSGTGKSRLALDLILASRTGVIAATKLIGDDRVRLDTRNGRIWVSGVPELEGMLEIRGLGIRRCGFVASAEVTLVVDLAASDAERLPPPERLKTLISGVELPRIPVAAGENPLPLVLGFLITN